MKEDNLALVKSIESGDPNLGSSPPSPSRPPRSTPKLTNKSGAEKTVYTVLLHLRRSHALGDFFRLLSPFPSACALLAVHARSNDVELLRDFYYQDDRRKEMACLKLEESLGEGEFGERVGRVREAGKAFGEDKEAGFETKVRFFPSPSRSSF